MTQEYVGSKIVTAWEQLGGPKIRVCGNTCHKGESTCTGYCEGKTDHAELLEQVPGYTVKDEAGKTVWVSKEVFEAAYLPIGHTGHLPKFLQRLIAEKVELADRLRKLGSFLVSKEDPRQIPQYELLIKQHAHMTAYFNVLVDRVDELMAPYKGQEDA